MTLFLFDNIWLTTINHILLIFYQCRIWKSKETQKQLKEAQKESYEERKRELNMAVVLLCVVILFITCQTIKIIPDIYEALYCSTEEVWYFCFWQFYFYCFIATLFPKYCKRVFAVVLASYHHCITFFTSFSS